MEKHNNLYYLLLEDQKNNLMTEEAKKRIFQKLETVYSENKPPGHCTDPPIESSE